MPVLRRLSRLLVLPVLLLVGCSTGPPYYERYEIKNLTVVLLDQQTLHERYEALYGKPALMLEANSNGETTKTVKGFYGYRTHTIYCSKMDFTVCGHELHHAIIGRFHAE